MTDSKTVLTVDDSRTIRDMLRVALTDAGYRVVQAADGVDGLAVLQTEHPDAIISDNYLQSIIRNGFRRDRN